MATNNNLGIFRFEKRDIERHLFNTLRIRNKFKTCFNYLVDKLGSNKVVSDLSKLTWSEGKNYKWVCIKDENVTLLIRKYSTHFTIFYKSQNKMTDDSDFEDYFNTKYGCFTFETNQNKVKNFDLYIDNNFKDLNLYIKDLIQIIKDNKVHGLWNDLMFKRKKHVEVKNIWDGDESISSIDLMLFACEELFQKYLEIFSETDMFEKIKTFNEGDMAGRYKVLEVHKDLKSEYYHGVGLTLQGTNGKDSESFNDVYSLSRWYHDDVFGFREEKE